MNLYDHDTKCLSEIDSFKKLPSNYINRLKYVDDDYKSVGAFELLWYILCLLVVYLKYELLSVLSPTPRFTHFLNASRVKYCRVSDVSGKILSG